MAPHVRTCGNTKLKGLLLRVALVLAGSLTVEVGLSVAHFVRQVIHLRKNSGWLFTALYLKQCAVSLQRYYGWSGEKKWLINQSSSVSVSLTRSGIPRIIPRHHRHWISLRNERSDFLVRWYLSLFQLAKVIKLAKPIKRV